MLGSAIALSAVSCAARVQPAVPASAVAVAAPVEPTATNSEPAVEVPKPRLSELCRAPHPTGDEPIVDTARRRLQETVCGATLWLDGLLGGEADVENAKRVSGRLELSSLYTEAEGFDPRVRLRVRYDLPNLERRVKLFLGREDQDQFIEDRREGLAIRSTAFGLEDQEKWLAGLGYSPPGRWAQRFDVRVGARVKSAPEIFAQGRLRRNLFVGDSTVVRLRETVFWENRDGFGSTSSADIDRVLSSDLLLRFGAVATISEATDGALWRNAVVLYRNLEKGRAIAGELFVRGETAAPVRLREYGTRAIFRFPLGRSYLAGEAIAGYTWPRKNDAPRREGSAMLGFGVELMFGSDPY
jgi:hypothetical protein